MALKCAVHCSTTRMMTSSNGNIFRVTGHLCKEFTGEYPAQRTVTRSFDIFFDLRLNKRLSKQWRGWWFETPSHSLWRHCNGALAALYAIWHYTWPWSIDNSKWWLDGKQYYICLTKYRWTLWWHLYHEFFMVGTMTLVTRNALWSRSITMHFLMKCTWAIATWRSPKHWINRLVVWVVGPVHLYI